MLNVFYAPLRLLPKTTNASTTYKQVHRNKRYQKIANSFSRVSFGIKFVTTVQAGEAKQHYEEIEFDKSSFSTLPSLNAITDFQESYVKMFL